MKDTRFEMQTPAARHEEHTGSANWAYCEPCMRYHDEVYAPAWDEYWARPEQVAWKMEHAARAAALERKRATLLRREGAP
jgi:hypothetical protein